MAIKITATFVILLCSTSIVATIICSLCSQGVATTMRTTKQCLAGVRTKDGRAKKFYGTRASLSFYKPKVLSTQSSSTRIKLTNGEESIEVGYMVNPEVFKDYEAHLYSKFTVGGKGCINTHCGRFVEVDTRMRLGIIPNTYSQIRGEKSTWNLTIEKDRADGNWWIILTEGQDKFSIGYWPKNLFSSMAEYATQVEWAGEVYYGIVPDSPPEMGSGYNAVYDTRVASFFRDVTVLKEDFKFVQPDETEVFSNCPKVYTVLDAGSQGDYWGRLMFYGGPRRPKSILSW
ncbi:protein neprosin-like [Silene latifolia]|uniref:protein neprosin-like n=1 Tax=Silene latifolia TaxID=37657 RepID=UPI003D77BF25